MLLTRKWQDTLDAQDTVVVALDIPSTFNRVWHGGLLEKLRAKGIQDDLLLLLENYLQGRTLPVEASVPQGSVLGPVLWKIYIDDLLRQLPEVSAFADDSTLSCIYPQQDNKHAADEINQQLRVIQEWYTRWQVTFAPEKTQAMVKFRSPAAKPAVEGKLCFDGGPLLLQEIVMILEMETSNTLSKRPPTGSLP